MATPSYVMGLTDFGRPPYTFTDLTSATFILKAAPDKLRAVCEDFLNVPLGRTADADKFVPNGAYRVLMCCSTFPIAEAEPVPPLPPSGFSAYREIALLISVFDRKHQQWSWYVPVLFIDGPLQNDEEWQAELPIAVGREMYGLPKTRGEVHLDPTYHCGKMERIDPKSPSYKVDTADAIEISLGVCDALTVEDELAAQGAELIELMITEQQLRQKRARGGRLVRLKRDLAQARRRMAAMKKKRDALAAKRRAAMIDLIRFKSNPRERKLLTPKEMIKMIWGGEPYAGVGARRPENEDEWLESLGFFWRERRLERTGPRLLMDSTGPIEVPESESEGDYEYVYWLLGLRQLHDPNPAAFGKAMIQQVVRTELRFDRLPSTPNKEYCVDIKDSPMAERLGIGPQKQTITAVDNYVYEGATSWFGGVATIVT